MSARNWKMGRYGRLVALLLTVLFALQVFFVVRVAVMQGVNTQSTSFQRSEAFRHIVNQHDGWSQKWVPYTSISVHIKRAVIAAEDDVFSSHGGVQWDAIEAAWRKNAKAQELAELRASSREKMAKKSNTQAPVVKAAKIVGGSTITQQLAKNLLLSGERNFFRKMQELVLTLALEVFLSKERILEVYLNNVEWGEGVFGIEAAAQHYFRKSAAQLSASESARLAVMLPRPKFFEKQPSSAYLSGRAGVILARMSGVQLPS